MAESEINTIRLMARLRTYINESRQKYLLIQQPITFDQLIACLDCIEDAEEAIKSYLAAEGRPYDYLSLYGLLQALFLQQDALRHLNKSLLNESLELHTMYPELAEIRKIRNLTSGHPTENKGKTFNQIIRMSLKKAGYTLVMRHHTDATVSQDIDLIELIAQQRKYIHIHLTKIIDRMEEKYKTHKDKFKDNPIMKKLPASLSYQISKLSEGISEDPGNIAIAKANCELLITLIDTIKEEMIARYESLDATISFNHRYSELNFALIKLNRLLTSKPHSGGDINVFATFIKIKFTELEELLTEVDRQFSE